MVDAKVRKVCVDQDSMGKHGCILQSLGLGAEAAAKPIVVPNFLKEVAAYKMNDSTERTDGVTHLPASHGVAVVPSLATFKSLFFAFAGPVARVCLPEGAYFTGSICTAASTLPKNLLRHVPDIEQLYLERLRVPDHLLRNFFREKMGMGETIKIVNDFLFDYDPFVTELNGIFDYVTEPYTYAPNPTCTAMNWLQEEDGEGPYARSDVDIIITAQSDEEAKAKTIELVEKVQAIVGESIVIQTPNGVTVVPHFPHKHIQIITLWMRSLAQYMLFVDLDCTALAYDGRKLSGCRRSLLAFTTMMNYIPKPMLFTRRDTPRRIGKYCRRGFGAFVAGPLSLIEEQAKMGEAAGHCAYDPPVFLDALFAEEDAEQLACSLMEKGHSYTESRLPRGYYVSPMHVVAFLEEFQRRARISGGKLITSPYTGQPHASEKLKVKYESWWRWGVII